MNAMRWAIFMTIAITLAGCETMRPVEAPEAPEAAPPPKVEAPPPTNELDRLLTYFEQIKRRPAADLGKEYESASLAFSRAQSDFNRLRLAMLLSIPNTAFNDEPLALDLLDPLVKRPESNLHGLAYMMSVHLQERRKLDASVQGLQQNVQGLQQKLDALKSLERSFIEREQGSPTRKR